MTNLPLANTRWIRNHSLEKIIQAYKDGSLDSMNDDIPSSLRTRPILLSKNTVAYVVKSEYALLYKHWDFVDVRFDLLQGRCTVDNCTVPIWR